MGGGYGSDGQKTACFLCAVFLILNLFNSLQRGSNGVVTEKTIISQESNIFKGGGGPTFSWGGGGGGFKCLFL